jgi:hypothetical protein
MTSVVAVQQSRHIETVNVGYVSCKNIAIFNLTIFVVLFTRISSIWPGALWSYSQESPVYGLECCCLIHKNLQYMAWSVVVLFTRISSIWPRALWSYSQESPVYGLECCGLIHKNLQYMAWSAVVFTRISSIWPGVLCSVSEHFNFNLMCITRNWNWLVAKVKN